MISSIPSKEITEQINDRIDKNLKLLEDSKDYKDIKEKLDKGNNFIDYFLVVGQEPVLYREKWLYSENLETLNSKYKFIEPFISFGSIGNKNKNNLFSD